MATAEAEASRDERSPPGGLVYDGFISYSHAADDLLAPRLQAGLQRFAKPWWKRRALRIFRDESSLSANPHLWASITHALDRSGWFVLLLSPEAAESPWVNDEVAYWLEHEDPDRIIPVLTEGEFGWVDGVITGDAMPAALQGAFSAEPRWVDLRFARTEDQLDLKNPRFSSAVADVAAALRGIPKDELESEEVKQHRRTIRTAWAATALVVVLGIVAAFAAVQSSRNAALAEARELAASAVGVVDTDPVLAKLLALEAISVTPGGSDQPVEVINSLWQAAAADRLVAVIDVDGVARVAVSDDGSRAVVTSPVGNVVRMYEAPSIALMWEWRLRPEDQPPSEDTVFHSTVNHDGSMVAVGVMEPAALLAAARPGATEDPRPNRIVILDGVDGSEIVELDYGDCLGVDIGVWSLDGRLAVKNGFEPCGRPEAPSGWWVEVFDTSTWESEAVLDLPMDAPVFGPIPEFDDLGRLFVFGARTTELYDADYELVSLIGESWGFGDATSDGAKIVTSDPESLRVSLYDTSTGQRLTFLTPFEFPQIPHGVRFSSDDNYVIYGNDTSHTLVWGVASAEILYRLPSGTAEWTHLDEGTMKAYTGDFEGEVEVWDLTPPRTGRDPVGDLGQTAWVDANSFALGPEMGAFVAADIVAGASFVRFFDRSSGSLIDHAPYPQIQSHDPDRFTETDRIVPMLDGRFVYNDAGRWMAYDPATGEQQFIVGCETDDFETCRDTGEPLFVLAASADGTAIVARPGGDADWLFFSAETGEIVGREAVDAPPGILTFSDDWVMGFNHNVIYAIDRQTGETLLDFPADAIRGDISQSGRLAAIKDVGNVVIVDTETWDARKIELGLGDLRAISISPDDSLLAVGDEQAIHIVDLGNDTVIQSVGVPRASDVYWLSANEILVGTSDGSWATVSLDVQNLIDEVRASMLRGFTPQECLTYRIDPCPTLEDIKSS